MTIKKLLIAGGGYADLPLIRAAKNLGYYVITSGNRPNELGHSESDKYCNADFSDPEAMLKLARELCIDAICPSCNDFSAISSAYVAEKLGLPGYDSYDTTILLHHKDKYRQFALQNGISTPKAMGFSDLDSALAAIESFKFPLIIKPVDLTGGKGITKISSVLEAKSSLENAFYISKTKRIVVEEYLEGSRHGFSALLQSGKIVFHFVDNEHYYVNPYMVSGASTPSSVSANVVNELVEQSEKIASLLSLKDGIFHVQFILNEGYPVIIEICRRPPGDLYTQFVKIATEVDYPTQIIKPFIDKNYEDISSTSVKGYFTRHCIMTDRSGVIENITYKNSIKDMIIDELLFWTPGMQVESFMTSKFGIIFLEYNSMDEMLNISNNLHNLIRIKFV